jgi:hypothetical protein
MGESPCSRNDHLLRLCRSRHPARQTFHLRTRLSTARISNVHTVTYMYQADHPARGLLLACLVMNAMNHQPNQADADNLNWQTKVTILQVNVDHQRAHPLSQRRRKQTRSANIRRSRKIWRHRERYRQTSATVCHMAFTSPALLRCGRTNLQHRVPPMISLELHRNHHRKPHRFF